MTNSLKTQSRGENPVGFLQVIWVVSFWLLIFAIGVWFPSRFYLESVIFGRPVKWETQVSGEVIFDVYVKGRQDFVRGLVEKANEESRCSETNSGGSRGFIRVIYEEPPGSPSKSGARNIQPVAQFHTEHNEEKVDRLLTHLYAQEVIRESTGQSNSAVRLIDFFSFSPRETMAVGGAVSAEKSVHVIYNLLPSGETAKRELPWWKRFLVYVPLGLISGSMINLAALCVLASIAGEYTRLAIDADRSPPEVAAASFRGFVVFLFFISGELLFLGNVTGGPTPDENLAELTQSAFVRTAGFASVVCLACSYNPAIIGLFLTKISALLDTGSPEVTAVPDHTADSDNTSSPEAAPNGNKNSDGKQKTKKRGRKSQ